MCVCVCVFGVVLCPAAAGQNICWMQSGQVRESGRDTRQESMCAVLFRVMLVPFGIPIRIKSCTVVSVFNRSESSTYFDIDMFQRMLRYSLLNTLDSNISTTVGWIDISIGTNIHGSHMMNPNDFVGFYTGAAILFCVL